LIEAGASGTWLHIAGPTSKILPCANDTGVAVVNFDYNVLPEEAMAALPNVCLDGNVKSLSFCLAAPKQVRAECDQLLNKFKGRGGFILSSGCEIPMEANPECIRAMVDAASRR
jgi:uroporphyrinogen decarboxylase